MYKYVFTHPCVYALETSKCKLIVSKDSMQLGVYVQGKKRGDVTGTLVLNETDRMLVAQGAHVLCEMLASNHSNCQILRAAESPHVEPGMPGMFWTLSVHVYVNLTV